MTKQYLYILLCFTMLFIGCKETGIHIIDNPDGTSVKVSFWKGNSDDKQPHILRIGSKGPLMEVKHNIDIWTKYNTPLQFDLENGQAITMDCNKSAQKTDYEGKPDVDWQGNPVMECLEHKVVNSTVPAIKIGATISLGV